jgi:hypothetical protein
VAVPDRDEVLLRLEMREVNLLVARLAVVATALATVVPLTWAVWPS